MKSVKIEHPLRTISFECDDTKAEMDFEKELLKDYIKLHDDAYAVDRKGNKLMYEYNGLVDDVALAKKLFAPIEILIDSLTEQIIVAKAEKNILLVKDTGFLESLNTYDNSINNFNETILQPLHQATNILDEEYDIFEEENGKIEESFGEYEDTFSSIFYEENLYCSIDKDSYNIDEIKFRETLEKIDKLWEFRNNFLDGYNNIIAWINEGLVKGANLQIILNELQDEDGLLDSSQSDSYLNGTGDESKKPIYFIDPSDDIVKEFKNKFGNIVAREVTTLYVEVGIDLVEACEGTMVNELIVGLQHYPKLIDKMVFGVKFNILDSSGIKLLDEQWKGHPKPLLWYQKMSAIPYALFFFEDPDVRGFILMGDFLAAKNYETDGENTQISGAVLQTVVDRLFWACYYFMVFAHNTCFNPDNYIKAFLADLEFPVTYELVKERFDADLIKGIEITVERQAGT